MIKDFFLANKSVENEKDAGIGDDKEEHSRRVKLGFVKHEEEHFTQQAATPTMSVR